MDLVLQQLINSVVLGAAYGLVTSGLFLIYSVLHIANFAHGAMVALGAYLQYMFVVQIGIPFFAALPMSMVGVGLVGLVLEKVVFRRLHKVDLLAVLIASLALAVVIQESLGLIWGTRPLVVPMPIEGTRSIGSLQISNYRLLIFVLVLVIAALLAWLVYRSGFGRKLRALAQNRELAALSGVRVNRVGAATFAVGSMLAGVAGGLLSAETIQPWMGFHPVLVAFVILVVVGGGGRLNAALIGGFVIALIETLTAGYVSNSLRQVAVFVLLVIFLMWRPEGAIRQPAAESARL